jgi:chemotaxis protein methyltransferase CheR
LCRVTISRFCRDRGVFGALANEVIPALAADTIEGRRSRLRAWSCGCASGEEPYTLAMLWQLELAPRLPHLDLEIIATDADLQMLARARRGVYATGSLKELAVTWRDAAFDRIGTSFRISAAYHRAITWCCQDVRQTQPRGPFDLILCRNLVFTYYQPPLQEEIARRLAAVLSPGGALVIGAHESLPPGIALFEPWLASEPVYRRS